MSEWVSEYSHFFDPNQNGHNSANFESMASRSWGGGDDDTVVEEYNEEEDNNKNDNNNKDDKGVYGHNSANFEAMTSGFCMVVDMEEVEEDNDD